MGLGLGGLQSGGTVNASTVIPALVGQDIVANSITLTQASGSNGLAFSTAGARLKLGPGTTDYLTSNGTTTITAAGDFATGGGITINNASAFNFANASSTFNRMGVEVLAFSSGIVQIKGSSATGSALKSVIIGNTVQMTAVTDVILSVQDGNLFSSNPRLQIGGTGRMSQPGTDSTGTPGAATIDKPVGRSSIAAGAATVTITNALVTAASLVFIQPLARDATGLLPAVTTTGAGSFIVTTAGNCTANLPFNWRVIEPI